MNVPEKGKRERDCLRGEREGKREREEKKSLPPFQL